MGIVYDLMAASLQCKANRDKLGIVKMVDVSSLMDSSSVEKPAACLLETLPPMSKPHAKLARRSLRFLQALLLSTN